MEENCKRNVWFTADLHLGHLNILKYEKHRIEDMGLKDENDIKGHDEFIIEMINSLTNRGDHLYMLGDFCLSGHDYKKKCIDRLKSNGLKIHLIVGNHDNGYKSMTNYYESVDLIKIVNFSKEEFSFLDEDFRVCMCHYPMLSWSGKSHGVMHLFGHTHSGFLESDDNPNLCMNVGLDNPKAACQLLSLQQVYLEYKHKLNGKSLKEYFSELEKNPKFIF